MKSKSLLLSLLAGLLLSVCAERLCAAPKTLDIYFIDVEGGQATPRTNSCSPSSPLPTQATHTLKSPSPRHLLIPFPTLQSQSSTPLHLDQMASFVRYEKGGCGERSAGEASEAAGVGGVVRHGQCTCPCRSG